MSGVSNLVQLQSRFLLSLSRLIIYANEQGYQVTLGRGWASVEANKADGGKERSLHLLKLAHDLCFFKDGVYLTADDDLKIFGDWWKAQGPEYAWGGDFPGDGNHFSIAYGGMK